MAGRWAGSGRIGSGGRRASRGGSCFIGRFDELTSRCFGAVGGSSFGPILLGRKIFPVETDKPGHTGPAS